MGVIAKGILRGCQGLFTPVSLGYPLSVFNKNSTLKKNNLQLNKKKSLGSPQEYGEYEEFESEPVIMEKSNGTMPQSGRSLGRR